MTYLGVKTLDYPGAVGNFLAWAFVCLVTSRGTRWAQIVPQGSR